MDASLEIVKSTGATTADSASAKGELDVEHQHDGWMSATVHWLVHALPTAVVLAGLGGLAYWGHHTGWKLPKFSALNGSSTAPKDDWCVEHSVPDSTCVECKPELLPKGKDYGWCKKHGIHNCLLDHPDVAQLAAQPEISAAELDRVRRALALRERPANNSRCPLYRRRIQFASVEDMDKAGVDIAVVEERAMTEFVAANAELGYDPTRMARRATPVPCRIWRVEKQIGERVKEGEILALVDAAEVGKAKAEFLQALAQVDLRSKTLERPLVGNTISKGLFSESESALREAQIRLVSSQQALLSLGLPISVEEMQGLAPDEIGRRVQFLGLPADLVKSLDPKTTTANLVPLKSPFGGIVVDRQAVVGDVADSTKILFVVVDNRQMWLTLNVRQEDAKYLALGQPVRFLQDASGAHAAGKIAWMSTAVDERTRTIKVRVDLPNPDGKLRAGAFGTGRIVLREEKNAVAVPSTAIHWDGSCNVVFVRDKDFLKKGAPKVFHVRTVRPGAHEDEFTEIIAGLLPGEVIASKGSGVLRAELLKNNLGAG